MKRRTYRTVANGALVIAVGAVLTYGMLPGGSVTSIVLMVVASGIASTIYLKRQIALASRERPDDPAVREPGKMALYKQAEEFLEADTELGALFDHDFEDEEMAATVAVFALTVALRQMQGSGFSGDRPPSDWNKLFRHLRGSPFDRRALDISLGGDVSDQYALLATFQHHPRFRLRVYESGGFGVVVSDESSEWFEVADSSTEEEDDSWEWVAGRVGSVPT